MTHAIILVTREGDSLRGGVSQPQNPKTPNPKTPQTIYILKYNIKIKIHPEDPTFFCSIQSP